MGRTPKPLSILAIGLDWPELESLRAQGHVVSYSPRDVHPAEQAIGPPANYDIVIGPNCWLMDEQHRKYLDLAIAEARRRRYPTETKNE